jgi:endo-1,4-beta-xylanase
MRVSIHGRHRAAVLLFLACAGLARPGTASADGEPLRVSAARREFFVGAAVSMSPLRTERAYQNTLAREFNVCVAENAFKFANTHPARTAYSFADTDALVAFARANGMRLRGHTLVWHQSLPNWLKKGKFGREEAIAILRDHILTLVGRYRGKVWAWDVVNEAVADGSASLRTESFWYRTIGPDYIELAFRFAHEADPGAILYYNDYGGEGMGAKSDGVHNLVRGLKEKGVPIHGVGWQMHVENGFQITPGHRENARRLAALGLELSVTELDVRIDMPVTADELASQATTYRDVLAFCLSEPNFKALLMWGFTDRYSWVPKFFPGKGAALIFDRRYRPKPAYEALREVLEEGVVSGFVVASASRVSLRQIRRLCGTTDRTPR